PEASCTELAVERAAPRSLHGHSVVWPSAEKVEARLHVIWRLENAGAQAIVTPLEPATAEIIHQARPGTLGAGHPDAVGVVGGLVRHEADVQSAQDDGHARRAVAVRQVIGLVDLRREGRDADQVEWFQRRAWIDFLHLAISDLDVRWRQSGHGE